MPSPVYNSINEFPGDGVTTQYEFNFSGGYISREHVRAYTTNALGVITEAPITDPMWINDNTLDLGVAAEVGGITRIYRDTPRDLPLVNFSTGSRITEANLDLLARQTVLGVAEAFDAGAYAAANDLLGAAGAALAAAQAAEASATVSAGESNASAIASQASRIASEAARNLAQAAQAAAEAARDDPAVQTVYDNIASINAVAANIAAILTVAGAVPAITTVASISAAVQDTAAIQAAIVTVAANIANINAAVADLPALAAKVNRTGDTMTGPLAVPAGATGAHVKRAEEIVWSAPVTVAAAGTATDITGIPIDATELCIGFKNIGLPANGTVSLRIGDSAGVFPAVNYASVSSALTSASASAVGLELTRFEIRAGSSGAAGTANGAITLQRLSHAGEWAINGCIFNTAEPRIAFTSGRCDQESEFLFNRIRLALVSGSFTGGSFIVKWRRS